MLSYVLHSGLIMAFFTTFLYPFSPAFAESRLYTNTNALFEACMQRCEEPTGLASLTRQGCYKGCAEIRREFTIRKSYRSMAACIEDMNGLELNRDRIIEQHQAWCDNEWTHLHKRKGCKDAMEVYIRAATVNSICYHQTPTPIAMQTSRLNNRASTMPFAPGSADGSVFSPPPAAFAIPETPVFDTPAYSPLPKQQPRATLRTPALKPPAQTAVQPASLPPKQADKAAKRAPSTKTAAKIPVVTPTTATVAISAEKDHKKKETPDTAPDSVSTPAPASSLSIPVKTPEAVVTPASPPATPPVITQPAPVIPAFSSQQTETKTPAPAGYMRQNTYSDSRDQSTSLLPSLQSTASPDKLVTPPSQKSTPPLAPPLP